MKKLQQSNARGIHPAVMWKVLILAAVNVSIYSPIYLKDIFYNVMRNCLELSHTQLGNVWGVYGLVALVSYPFSGWLADRFSPRTLISIALAGEISMAVLLSRLPAYGTLLWIFGIMGMFSILIYYATINKLLQNLDPNGNGQVFGWFWGMSSFFNLVIYATGMLMIKLYPQDYGIVYRNILQTIVALGVVSLLCFRRQFPQQSVCKVSSAVSLREIRWLLGNGQLWLVSIAIMTSYLTSCGMVYMTPYLLDVCHLSQEKILWINLVRGYLLGMAAPVVIGAFTDHVGSVAKVMIATMIIVAICCLGLLVLPGSWVWISVPIILLADSVGNGVKGQSVILVPEIRIPQKISGCAIGLTAVIGYAPDAFAYSWMGSLIDNYGNQGYRMLFVILMASGLICAGVCGILLLCAGKHTAAYSAKEQAASGG